MTDSPRKLNIVLTPKDWDVLERIKREDDSSYTEAVRRGLRMLDWLDKLSTNGETVLVRDENGSVREIEFIF